MKITGDQAQKLMSLGAALKEQALFQRVREDDAPGMVEMLANRSAADPQTPGNVSQELLGLLLTIALAENSVHCLPLILPRIDPTELHGPALSRVMEKDNLAGYRAINDFLPLSRSMREDLLEKAAFHGSPRVLAALLEDADTPCCSVVPWQNAAQRGHHACLEALIQHQPGPSQCHEAMVYACVRKDHTAIAMLLPHTNIAHALCSLLAMNHPDPWRAADALADPYLATASTDDWNKIFAKLDKLKDPANSVPRLHAYQQARQLQQATPTPPASPTPRL